MSDRVRLVLALHNHQPVGNFGGVFEAAYADSYAPFLRVLAKYPQIPISLHTSGCLMEWLAEHHPEYIDDLGEFCRRGQVEILGGGFQEPILTMIPPRDRIGQIRAYTEFLAGLFDCRVRGMWVPERVWEPNLVSDLADAGIEYTILDDFHFLAAGLQPHELYGPFLSEDDGRLIRIFPGSEKLRYTIPFAEPQETLDYLEQIGARQPDAVVVLGDDGEKFGTWPGTHKHVYKDGWLKRFFDLLVANQDWLSVTTLAEAADSVPPQGKIYLPTASYREMTEWALPAGKLVEFERLAHELEQRPDGQVIRSYLRGGFWRNFKVKYPESNEMYARMLEVSRRLAEFESATPRRHGRSSGNGSAEAGTETPLLDTAREELYRGQCNCAYWHGAFGGLYLPHLRNAVFKHLIAADTALEAVARPDGGPWVEIAADDYDLDARQEVRLANDQLVAYVAPARGGLLYELDLRDLGHNLLATLNRRPEAYHRRIVEAAGRQQGAENVQSIHALVKFKQKDLDKKLCYDRSPRKGLVDHLFRDEPRSTDVVTGRAPEIAGAPGEDVFEASLRRAQDFVKLTMRRDLPDLDAALGSAPARSSEKPRPCPTLTKTVSLSAGSSVLEIEYALEGLPLHAELHLAVEMNFAGIPAGASDRYFTADGARLGQVETELDLRQIDRVGLVDEWLGLGVTMRFARPAGIWTFPIQTVSQSESGFELVHQSAAVLPHWTVRPDATGRWQSSFTLHLDTTTVKAREQRLPVAVG